MPSRRLVAIIEVTLAVIIWGGTFVATKIALRQISPAGVVWLRFGVGIIVLGVVVGLRRQFQLPGWRDLLYFSLLGFLGITFHQWLQSTGLLTSQATTTAWIVATTPIFMAILGWLVLKERLAGLQILGIALAALGVVLVVTRGDLGSLTQGKFGAPGDLLIMLSAPNWAVFSTLSRRGLSNYPATLMVFYVMVLGWLFSSVLFFLGPGLSELAALHSDGWTAVLFLGILGSGAAYIFWYDALQILPVAQVGAFVYLEPFVTVIVAAALLLEPVTWASLLGGAGILAGVWLVNRTPKTT